MRRLGHGLAAPQRAGRKRPVDGLQTGQLHRVYQLTPDNIESNIISVSGNTREAAEELTTAHEYQRKAGRRMACLLMILVVVICVVILAVSSCRACCS